MKGGPQGSDDAVSSENALKRVHWIRFLPLLLIIIGVVAYRNSLDCGFIFDDANTITDNPAIHALRPIFYWPSRFVVNLTFKLNYAIGRFNVVDYHVVNLLIHVLAGLTLFGVIRRTLLSDMFKQRYQQSAPWLALIGATIWLAHPLQTESVTYICQRYESMMGLFYLLTVYCFIRGVELGKGALWHGMALIFCALGYGQQASHGQCARNDSYI